jgi:simple sugar transport system substrate-binding protein
MKSLFSSLFMAAALFATPALAGDGPVDTTNVRKDILKSETKKEYTIATVVKVDGIAWFDRMRDGVDQFAEETGHDTWMKPSNRS